MRASTAERPILEHLHACPHCTVTVGVLPDWTGEVLAQHLDGAGMCAGSGLVLENAPAPADCSTACEPVVLHVRASQLRVGDVLLAAGSYGFRVDRDADLSGRVLGHYPGSERVIERWWNPDTRVRVRRERTPSAGLALGKHETGPAAASYPAKDQPESRPAVLAGGPRG